MGGTSLHATLTGKAETPKGDPDGSGTAEVKITGKSVCWEIKATGVDDADRRAHPQGRPRRRRPGRRPVRRRLQGEGLPGHDRRDRRRDQEEPRRATTSTCTTRSTRAARCAASSQRRRCRLSPNLRRSSVGGRRRHAPWRACRCPPRRAVDSPSDDDASQLRSRRCLALGRGRGRRAAAGRGRVDRRDRVRRVRRAPPARRPAPARRLDRRRRHEADARARARARCARCGADLAAHCINDVLTTGATPLMLLDYVAAGRDRARAGRRARRGRRRGLPRGRASRSSAARRPSCPGSTATGELDFAGTCVGDRRPRRARRRLDGRAPATR